MTSAAGTSEVDALARPALRNAGGALDMKAMGLAARLASTILNPVGYVDETRCGVGPLPPSVVKRIAADRSFGRPINRALSKELALDAINFDPALFERLPVNLRSRLALKLVTASAQDVATAALLTATCVLHRRVIGLVMKADRSRFVSVVGEAAFEVATREVPILHSSLAELDKTDGVWTACLDGDQAQMQLLLMRFGLQVLAAFIDAVEPDLTQLFVLRYPEDMQLSSRRQSVGEFRDVHIDQLVKLLCRRMESWTDIIG